jgi:hypothetical protein
MSWEGSLGSELRSVPDFLSGVPVEHEPRWDESPGLAKAVLKEQVEEEILEIVIWIDRVYSFHHLHNKNKSHIFYEIICPKRNFWEEIHREIKEREGRQTPGTSSSFRMIPPPLGTINLLMTQSGTISLEWIWGLRKARTSRLGHQRGLGLGGMKGQAFRGDPRIWLKPQLGRDLWGRARGGNSPQGGEVPAGPEDVELELAHV